MNFHLSSEDKENEENIELLDFRFKTAGIKLVGFHLSLY